MAEKLTIPEYAERVGVEYATARARVRTLVREGLATEAGKQAREGRGRPAVIFNIKAKGFRRFADSRPVEGEDSE